MIHLYQIASNDFNLFQAEQLAAQAAEVVRRLNPASVIIRRRNVSNVYYLYSAQNFLDQITQAAGAQSILTTLRLHELAATPDLDLYEDAESAPSCCVVTDGDLVIGFCDAALPPSQRIRKGDSGKDVTVTPVSRWLRTEFAEKVPLNQITSLLVWLTRRSGEGLALPVAVPTGTEVDVVIQVQRGFALEGSGEGSLMVIDEDETLPIQFKLRATKIGPGRIRVLCFQRGQPLGEIILTPTVVVAEQELERESTIEQQSLAPLNVTQQPDLTLLILEHELHGKPAITLRLSALDPTLELNLKLFGPVKLRMDPLQYFQDFFKDIEGLPIRTTEDQAIATKKLALKGARLFQDLLPEDLRVLLWTLRDHIQSVQVLSDEPWIPWELLRLQGKENGRIVEGPFLCEAFAMTRWFPGIGRRPQLFLHRMGVVVPTDSGLLYAQEERDFLFSLADVQRQVIEISASYLELLEALSRSEYDSWHFTGHGEFVAPDPNRSAILLERGQRLCAEEICGQVSNCGLARPLVFLNACQTGREALSLTGVGGWARHFIEAGAAGFIGSLWSVYDKAASEFTKVFYNHLLVGETIGQAVKEARIAIRPLNDPTWLAYTVFADPLANVKDKR